jgi:hypothetical protein
MVSKNGASVARAMTNSQIRAAREAVVPELAPFICVPLAERIIRTQSSC